MKNMNPEDILNLRAFPKDINIDDILINKDSDKKFKKMKIIKGLLFSFMLFFISFPKEIEIAPKLDDGLIMLQEHSKRINSLELQVKELIERNDLTVSRLEETFQLTFCLLDEIKWLMNNNSPSNFIINDKGK